MVNTKQIFTSVLYVCLFLRCCSLTCRNNSHSTPVTDMCFVITTLQRGDIALMLRAFAGTITGGSIKYTDALIMSLSNSDPYGTDMRGSVDAEVQSCMPVCIGHQGDWSTGRAADDRCVHRRHTPRASVMPPTTIETIAFANEEHRGGGQNV